MCECFSNLFFLTFECIHNYTHHLHMVSNMATLHTLITSFFFRFELHVEYIIPSDPAVECYEISINADTNIK